MKKFTHKWNNSQIGNKVLHKNSSKITFKLQIVNFTERGIKNKTSIVIMYLSIVNYFAPNDIIKENVL